MVLDLAENVKFRTPITTYEIIRQITTGTFQNIFKLEIFRQITAV